MKHPPVSPAPAQEITPVEKLSDLSSRPEEHPESRRTVTVLTQNFPHDRLEMIKLHNTRYLKTLHLLKGKLFIPQQHVSTGFVKIFIAKLF